MGKTDKYFIYDTPSSPIHPDSHNKKNDTVNIVSIMDELNGTVKGAFYLEANLVVRKPEEHGKPAKPHNHNFSEYMVFMGTNPEDPFDLGAEIEFWLDDEKHMITKSCAVFVPKGMYHCPIIMHRVDRPFVWITTGDTVKYSGMSYSKDPKWADYSEMPEELVRQLPDWIVMEEQKKKYNL